MQFLCDEIQKIAVASLNTQTALVLADPAATDTLIVSAVRVEAIPSPTTPRLWEPLSPAGGTFRAAIGRVTQPPIAGTFTVTFGADTTSALAFDISVSGLNTALNGLASIISAGGVVVSLVSGDFLITFNSHGSRAEITADASNLAPEGTIAEIGTFLDGSSTVSEVQFLRFVQSPAAFVDLTEAAPGPDGTVVENTVGGGGANAVYTVTLYTTEMDGSVLNAPYDGRFSLAVGGQTSPLMAWDIGEADMVAALESMTSIGVGNVSAFLQSPGVYVIGFQAGKADTDMGTMTLDPSALMVVPYMTGALDLSNPAIQLILGNAVTASAIFVIEYTPSAGNRREIFRLNITLVQALIADGSLTPTPQISFYTKAETDAAILAAFHGVSFSGSSGGSLQVTIGGQAFIIAYSDGASLDIGSGGTLDTGAYTSIRHGTFTLVAGVATVTDALITANSVISPTVKTVGGTRAGNPDIVPTASTGFTATGGTLDTSTYNYTVIG